jgi:hypothetical protein
MPDGGLTTLVFALFIRIRVGSMERRLSVPSISKPNPQVEEFSDAWPKGHVLVMDTLYEDGRKVTERFQNFAEATKAKRIVEGPHNMKIREVRTAIRYRRSSGFWRRKRR